MPPLPVRARTVRWLLLLALIAPLAVGVTGVGDRQAGATSGSPAAVAVNFALRQLGRATRPAAGLRGLLPVQLGERSNAVAAVQRRLAASGICVAVDGEFGPLTRKAVRAFQRAHGLTADGVIGRKTWGALVVSGRQRTQARC
jgi:peptidoglycan hydrolase-like protein with peptidoglycan-binding domain